MIESVMWLMAGHQVLMWLLTAHWPTLLIRHAICNSPSIRC